MFETVLSETVFAPFPRQEGENLQTSATKHQRKSAFELVLSPLVCCRERSVTCDLLFRGFGGFSFFFWLFVTLAWTGRGFSLASFGPLLSFWSFLHVLASELRTETRAHYKRGLSGGLSRVSKISGSPLFFQTQGAL